MPSSLHATPQKHQNQQQQQQQSKYEHDELYPEDDEEEEDQQLPTYPSPFFCQQSFARNNNNNNSHGKLYRYSVKFRSHYEWFTNNICNEEFEIGAFVVVNGDNFGLDVGQVEKKEEAPYSYFFCNKDASASPYILERASAEQTELLCEKRNLEAGNVLDFFDDLPINLLRSRQFAHDYHCYEMYSSVTPSAAAAGATLGNQQQQHQQQPADNIDETNQQHHRILRSQQDPMFDLYPVAPPSRDEVDEILRLFRQYNFVNAEYQFDKRSLCVYFTESLRYVKRVHHWKQEQRFGSRAAALAQVRSKFYGTERFFPSVISVGTHSEEDQLRDENSLSAFFRPEDYPISRDAFYCFDPSVPEYAPNNVLAPNFTPLLKLLARRFKCKVWLLNCGRRVARLPVHPFHRIPPCIARSFINSRMNMMKMPVPRNGVVPSFSSTPKKRTTTVTTTSAPNNNSNIPPTPPVPWFDCDEQQHQQQQHQQPIEKLQQVEEQEDDDDTSSCSSSSSSCVSISIPAPKTIKPQLQQQQQPQTEEEEEQPTTTKRQGAPRAPLPKSQALQRENFFAEKKRMKKELARTLQQQQQEQEQQEQQQQQQQQTSSPTSTGFSDYHIMTQTRRFNIDESPFMKRIRLEKEEQDRKEKNMQRYHY